MRAWVDAAVLVKAKNLKGGLVVRSTAGLPFLLDEGVEVAFVPPQTDLPRRAQVSSVRQMDARAAEVEFSGIDGTAARGLVGCHCLVRRNVLDGAPIEEEPVLWDGWLVVDASVGEVGCVCGLVENPGQYLLEVERADGQGTLLVPVVDEIIREVDAAARIVRVILPNGLLDL